MINCSFDSFPFTSVSVAVSENTVKSLDCKEINKKLCCRAQHRKNLQMFLNPREEERKRLVVFVDGVYNLLKMVCMKYFIKWCAVDFFPE